jgi:predicted DNA-binding protein
MPNTFVPEPETIVVSCRLRREHYDEVSAIAKDERRTRANVVAMLIENALEDRARSTVSRRKR